MCPCSIEITSSCQTYRWSGAPGSDTIKEVVHNLCKSCGTPVLGGWVKRKRQVELVCLLQHHVMAHLGNDMEQTRQNLFRLSYIMARTCIARNHQTLQHVDHILLSPRDWNACVPLFPGRSLVLEALKRCCIVLSSPLEPSEWQRMAEAYFSILCVATLTGKNVFFFPQAGVSQIHHPARLLQPRPASARSF